jgi:hypothetical protein
MYAREPNSCDYYTAQEMEKGDRDFGSTLFKFFLVVLVSTLAMPPVIAIRVQHTTSLIAQDP